MFPAHPGALLSHLLSTNYKVCFYSFRRQRERSLTRRRSFAECHATPVSASMAHIFSGDGVVDNICACAFSLPVKFFIWLCRQW